MVHTMSNICKCTHSKEDHVTAHIKPDGVDGETTGYILMCTQCLCREFEPKERTEEEGTKSCAS